MKYIGTKKVETERLILRKIRIEDAEDAYKNWCSSKNVSRYVTWNVHKSVLETEELFKMWVEDYENLNTYKWIVEIKDTKEVIGTIDVVHKKHMEYDCCDIGYVYGEAFWGRGYATEALKAVIKFLFEEADAYIICADHMSNNPASGEVMKKSGMKYDGTLRGRMIDKDGLRNDLVSYSITKEEFNS